MLELITLDRTLGLVGAVIQSEIVFIDELLTENVLPPPLDRTALA